jgi:hypothetical protein
VNQFSPIICAQRLSIAAAKIVSPPRGTIMLCNIICAEARQHVLCRQQKVYENFYIAKYSWEA